MLLRLLTTSLILGGATVLSGQMSPSGCAAASQVCNPSAAMLHASLSSEQPASLSSAAESPTTTSQAAAAPPAKLTDLFGNGSLVKSLVLSLSPYTEISTATDGKLLLPVEDTAANTRPQYRYGKDFLVMATQTSVTRETVTLPQGVWVNYWTGSQILGGSTVQLDVPADVPPMWVRGGAIIQRRTGGFDSIGFLEKRLTNNAKNCADSCMFEVLPAYSGEETVQEKDPDGRTLTRSASSLHIQGLNTHAVMRWRFTRVKNVRVNGEPVKVMQSPEGFYASFDHNADTLVEWTVQGFITRY